MVGAGRRRAGQLCRAPGNLARIDEDDHRRRAVADRLLLADDNPLQIAKAGTRDARLLHRRPKPDGAGMAAILFPAGLSSNLPRPARLAGEACTMILCLDVHFLNTLPVLVTSRHVN